MSELISVMLTWEFPPRIIGGIAPHVYELSRALVGLGVEVHVLTCDFPGAAEYEDVEGVHVQRVDSYVHPTPDFPTWIAMMNVNLQRAATELMASLRGRPQILHAHDWLVANAAIGLKHLFRTPLVATVHSTEHGRRSGIHNVFERTISATEAWLTQEAWRVICCSGYMIREVSTVLGVPGNKLDLIPNGIDEARFGGPSDQAALRGRFTREGEPLVLFVGRLVHEKGVHLLVEAIPRVLQAMGAKFVIVGEGPLKEQLSRRVQELGVAGATQITGFLDAETVRLLFQGADVCVIPSLYEPFGIVALEAMAAGAPVVTTGAGGLGEIVGNDGSGVIVPPSPDSLAAGIRAILGDPGYADRVRQAAHEKVRLSYRWEAIADSTLGVYRRVIQEYDAGTWKPT